MTRALLIALPAALALPGAAHAATVSTTYDPGGPEKGRTPYYGIAYAAAPGEANDVSVRREGDALVVADATAPLAAAGLCATVDAHTARCPATHGGLTGTVSVALGDGADRAGATPEAGFVPIRGGDGADVLSGSFLEGGAGDDTLDGGDGDDFLSPGPGADVVRAGGGDDVVEAGDDAVPGDDRLDGGDGADTVRYGEPYPARGVTIDLAAGTARGAAHGADALAGVEHASGGAGPDVLLGDAGANRLSGLGGRDRVVGGDGPDRVAGGNGADAVDGGAGDDLLVAGADGSPPPDATGDRFACGAGRDAVKFTYRRDLVGRDCEALDNTRWPEDALGAPFHPHPRAAAGGRLVFRVPCMERRCAVDVTLAVPAGRLARAHGSGRGPVRVVVRLDRRARRLLRAAGGVARVTVSSGDGLGYVYRAALTGSG